ncbi:MAG: REP element-mobilizing transposase RayT [Paraglaciecola sp.]|jgi:REP element-mobilizing transposase RayT
MGRRTLTLFILCFCHRQRGYRICAYAVMSNHTHVVLHVDKTSADVWDADEVLRRYHKLHKGTQYTEGIRFKIE